MGVSIASKGARLALVVSTLFLATSHVASSDSNRVQDPHFDYTPPGAWHCDYCTTCPFDATGTPGSSCGAMVGVCAPVVGQSGIAQVVPFSVIAGATYSFGASVRGSVTPGGAAGIVVDWGIRTPDGGCGVLSTDATPMAGPPDSWQATSLSTTAPAGVECAVLRASVSCMPGNPQLAYVDDVYFFRVGTTGAFHTVSPCRVLDTRGPAGPLGGPSLTALEQRVFTIAGTCGIPANATDVAANVTVTNATADGHLEIWTPGGTIPYTSVLNFRAFQPRANNAVLRLDIGGRVVARALIPEGSADLAIDVVGYYE